MVCVIEYTLTFAVATVKYEYLLLRAVGEGNTYI